MRKWKSHIWIQLVMTQEHTRLRKLKQSWRMHFYPSQELFPLHTYPNSQVEEVVCIKWRWSLEPNNIILQICCRIYRHYNHLRSGQLTWVTRILPYVTGKSAETYSIGRFAKLFHRRRTKTYVSNAGVQTFVYMQWNNDNMPAPMK